MTITETRAVDYSDAKPSPALIKAKGYVGAGRYIALGSPDKHLTKAEGHRLRAGGLFVWLVAEGEADRATRGEALGQSDARLTEQAAWAVGYPKSAPLFAAVDFDADPAQVAAYVHGWAARLGKRAGLYGGIRVIDAFAGTVSYLWQTAAWSGGKLSPHAHIYQRVTMTNPIGGCDENVVCKPIRVWGGVMAPPSAGHPRALIHHAVKAAPGPARIAAMHALAFHPAAPKAAREAATKFLTGHHATVAALDTLRKLAGAS